MREIKSGGKFKLEDCNEEYDGELFLNDKKGIIRLVLYEDNLRDFFANKIPNKMKFITGLLTSSAKLTLYNCRVIGRHSHNLAQCSIIIDCEYLFDGIIFSEARSIRFNKMYFDIAGIIGWSGLSGFEFPQNDEYVHVVAYRRKESITCKINENTEVSFEANIGTITSDTNCREYKLEQFIEISLQHKDELIINDNMEILKSVISLVSLGIGSVPDIIKIEAFNNNHFYSYDNQKHPKPIRIYDNNLCDENFNEPKWYDLLFSLDDLIIEDGNLMENWFNKYHLMEPISELYLGVLNYKSMSAERMFLNIIQALETYHMRFITNKLKDFNNRIEEIYEPDLVNIILSDTQKSQKYILIRSRLLDLIMAENKIWFFFNSKRTMIDFIDKCVYTRHYHTHYAINKKSKAYAGEDLSIATYILKAILEYYMLQEIGLKQDRINKNIEKASTNIREVLNAFVLKLQDK